MLRLWCGAGEPPKTQIEIAKLFGISAARIGTLIDAGLRRISDENMSTLFRAASEAGRQRLSDRHAKVQRKLAEQTARTLGFKALTVVRNFRRQVDDQSHVAVGPVVPTDDRQFGFLIGASAGGAPFLSRVVLADQRNLQQLRGLVAEAFATPRPRAPANPTREFSDQLAMLVWCNRRWPSPALDSLIDKLERERIGV